MARISESSHIKEVSAGKTTEEILRLGTLLASELDSNDTLGRWMAHYLSEQLIYLEGTNGSEKRKSEDNIADLILRFWSIRRQLPIKQIPFAEIDDVEAAISRLVPSRRTWAFFNEFSDEAKPSEAESETNALLRSALLIDKLAGDLVYALVVQAAEVAENKEAKWVELAEKAEDKSLATLRRIYTESGLAEGKTNPQDPISNLKHTAESLSATITLLISTLGEE